MLNNREAGREEEIWIVIKEQSLLAQKRNDVFQNFRYWFKPDTGQGVDLVCCVDSLRSLWFRLRDSSPFSFTPGREFPEAELCVPPPPTQPPAPSPPGRHRGTHTSAGASALQVTLPFSSFFQMFGIHFVLQSFCTQAKPISILALGHRL